MYILNTTGFVSEKLNIKPATKENWSKIPKIDTKIGEPMLNKILNNYNITPEQFDDILSENVDCKRRFSGQYNRLIGEIIEVVDKVYEEAINLYNNKDLDNNTVIIATVPKCVVCAMIINHFFAHSLPLDIEYYEEYIGHGETFQEYIELLTTSDFLHQCRYIANFLMHLNLQFNWTLSGEGRPFWNDLYHNEIEGMVFIRVSDSGAIKKSKFHKITNLDIYQYFLKTHPECQEEIESFCK